MKKLHIAIILVLAIITLAACGGGEGIKDPLNYEVSDFSYVNQDNEQVSLSDLKEKVWIADFIFTSCTDVCPFITPNMAKLQSMVKEEGLDVQFISFTADPEVDTPEVLKEYAANYQADLSNWDFLTGYSQEEIKKLGFDSFKTIVDKVKGGVVHQNYFYLVNQEGKVLKTYSAFQDVPFDEIVKDVKTISK